MVKTQKIQMINFFMFFVGWATIFLLGADFPPPVGFIGLLLLILFLDIIQAIYLGKYFLNFIETYTTSKLFFSNLLFYFLGGFIVSLCTSIPLFESVEISNCIVWISVVTIVGSIYGIVFWVFNCFLYRLL